MNKKDFLNKLIQCFPDIKEEILDNDYNGLFSLQVGVFRDITQKAIDTHDLENVEKYTQFILDNFDDFDDDVNNVDGVGVGAGVVVFPVLRGGVESRLGVEFPFEGGALAES